MQAQQMLEYLHCFLALAPHHQQFVICISLPLTKQSNLPNSYALGMFLWDDDLLRLPPIQPQIHKRHTFPWHVVSLDILSLCIKWFPQWKYLEKCLLLVQLKLKNQNLILWQSMTHPKIYLMIWNSNGLLALAYQSACNKEHRMSQWLFLFLTWSSHEIRQGISLH